MTEHNIRVGVWSGAGGYGVEWAYGMVWRVQGGVEGTGWCGGYRVVWRVQGTGWCGGYRVVWRVQGGVGVVGRRVQGGVERSVGWGLQGGVQGSW